MVGLVDEDCIDAFADTLEFAVEAAPALEVRMIVDLQTAVRPAEVGEVTVEGGLPDRLASRLRHEEGDVLTVVEQAFDEHQPDERLAQPDAVAKKRAAVLPRYFQERVIAFLLILVEDGVHVRSTPFGPGQFPLAGGHLVPFEKLLQGFGVDLKGGVFADVPLDEPQNLRRDVLGGVPMFFVPLLQDGDRRAGDLHVQLDVLGDAGVREVGRTDQPERADDFLPRVREIAFGVELVAAIDAAANLAVAEGRDDGRDAREEVVFFFFLFEAAVESRLNLCEAGGERGLGPLGDFVAHQNADRIDLLPLVLQREQRTDLEIAGRDVDGLRQRTPIAQVTNDLPVVIAIIDDKKFAASFAGTAWHGFGVANGVASAHSSAKCETGKVYQIPPDANSMCGGGKMVQFHARQGRQDRL